MNPARGQLVEIRFNNGVFFDAIVEDWTDQKSIVKLITTNETVIIQKTLQDVLLVKIMQEKKEQGSPEEQGSFVCLGDSKVFISGLKPKIIDNGVREEFDELKNQPITDDSLKRIVELKDEMNKLDRQELLGDISTFKPSGAREINYGFTGYIPISRTAQHTNKEIAPTDSEFDSELQGLFNQEH